MSMTKMSFCDGVAETEINGVATISVREKLCVENGGGGRGVDFEKVCDI